MIRPFGILMTIYIVSMSIIITSTIGKTAKDQAVTWSAAWCVIFLLFFGMALAFIAGVELIRRGQHNE